MDECCYSLQDIQKRTYYLETDKQLNEYRNKVMGGITDKEMLNILMYIHEICIVHIENDLLLSPDLMSYMTLDSLTVKHNRRIENKYEYFWYILMYNFGIRKLEYKNNEISYLPEEGKKYLEGKNIKFALQLDYHNEYTIFRKYGLKNFFNILHIILDKTLIFLENISNEGCEEIQLVNNCIYNVFCFMNENGMFTDENNREKNILEAYYFYPSEIGKDINEIILMSNIRDLKLSKIDNGKNAYSFEKQIDSINIKIDSINKNLKKFKGNLTDVRAVKCITQLNIIIENICLCRLSDFCGEGKIYTSTSEVYLYLLTNLNKKHFDVRNYKLKNIFDNVLLKDIFKKELLEDIKITKSSIEKVYCLCVDLKEKFGNEIEAIYKFEKSFRFFYLICGYQLLMNNVFKNNKKLLDKAIELFEAILVMPNCFANIIFLKKVICELIINKKDADSNSVGDNITNIKFFNDAIVPYYNILFSRLLNFVFEDKGENIISEDPYKTDIDEFYKRECYLDLTFNKAEKHDVELFSMLACSINKKLCTDNTKTDSEIFSNFIHILNYKILSNSQNDMIKLDSNPYN